jgi:hypothetical protein
MEEAAHTIARSCFVELDVDSVVEGNGGGQHDGRCSS